MFFAKIPEMCPGLPGIKQKEQGKIRRVKEREEKRWQMEHR